MDVMVNILLTARDSEARNWLLNPPSQPSAAGGQRCTCHLIDVWGAVLTYVECRSCLWVLFQLLVCAHSGRQVVSAGQHICIRVALEKWHRVPQPHDVHIRDNHLLGTSRQQGGGLGVLQCSPDGRAEPQSQNSSQLQRVCWALVCARVELNSCLPCKRDQEQAGRCTGIR